MPKWSRCSTTKEHPTAAPDIARGEEIGHAALRKLVSRGAVAGSTGSCRKMNHSPSRPVEGTG